MRVSIRCWLMRQVEVAVALDRALQNELVELLLESPFRELPPCQAIREALQVDVDEW